MKDKNILKDKSRKDEMGNVNILSPNANFNAEFNTNFNFGRYSSSESSDINQFSKKNKEFFSLSLIIYFDTMANGNVLSEIKKLDEIVEPFLEKDEMIGKVIKIKNKTYPFNLKKFLAVSDVENLDVSPAEIDESGIEEEFIEKIVLSIFFTDIEESNIIYDFLNNKIKAPLNNDFSISTSCNINFSINNTKIITKIKNNFKRLEEINNQIIVNCIDSEDIKNIREKIFKKRFFGVL